MALKQVLDILELLDRPLIAGSELVDLFAARGLSDITVEPEQTDKGSTTFVKLLVPGARGRSGDGDAPTLGIIGFLGGVGARPEVVGLVSDGDGAVTALAAGLKLADMHSVGDALQGDVIVATHVSPNAPVIPHEPVPFMGSPVSMDTMCELLVDERMDAILSIDTTKGNRVINTRGFAISPTVMQGYILRVSETLLDLQQHVLGRPPAVFAISMQDITPYANELFHLNSILQPATATTAPVVGVAITAETAVPGCATGASHEVDIAMAARFSVEVAKAYTAGRAQFYDAEEFSRLERLYGSMKHLQTSGKES
ncbi:MAG: DUF1177 domain-containing protein [Gemmatimonadota bacterium]|nr:MAG: DUF1177 domain-containing protein [Gemmatimonadota bacterium]